MSARPLRLIGALATLLGGCARTAPPGALVITQTPMSAAAETAATELDARYPAGSRVVLATPPYRSDAVVVLSHGFIAAGGPCVSWDGRWVFFSGKRGAESEWQIYKVRTTGGLPEPVTKMPGGAMEPALAAHGELVFSSPVPRVAEAIGHPLALYGQTPGGPVRRLTFGPRSAASPTILRDGRILFVTCDAHGDLRSQQPQMLFTISNDGTEVTAYACQDDGAPLIRRPRELTNGRVAFVAASNDERGAPNWAESVRSAAPFVTRARLWPFLAERCRAVEPWGDDLLVCAETTGWVGRSMTGHADVYQVTPNATGLGAPLFDDPEWNSIEAVSAASRPEPAAHNSAIMAAEPHGTVLCLNVNDSRDVKPATVPAAELRVTAMGGDGKVHALGRVPVAPDGSVMLEVPVDVPLGFETLDRQGRVIRRQPPYPWLRPGENRACVGCHERRNHAPRNIRALATATDALRLESYDVQSAPVVTAP